MIMLNAFATGWACAATIKAACGIHTTTPTLDIIAAVVMFITTGYIVMTRGDYR